MLKIFYISPEVVILFFAGVILYGVILNLREVTLKRSTVRKRIDQGFENVQLSLIDKKIIESQLYSNKILIKTYKAVFGKSSSTIKTSATDNITPIGDYKIFVPLIHHQSITSFYI